MILRNIAIVRELALCLVVTSCATSAAGSHGAVDTRQAACSGTAPAEHRADSPAWAIKLDRYLDSLAATGHAGVVLVQEGHKTTFARGFGLAQRSPCIPDGPTTSIDIGSIAKSFTATAVMQLEERGLLRLSDSLPQFFDSVPADKRSITIGDLLTHTAGLQSYHDTAGDFEAMTKQEAVKRILADTLRFAPHTREAYSNSGYTLLAAIVERLTNTSLKEYVETHIFRPSGLTHTWFWGDERIPESIIAHGYIGAIDRGDPRIWPVTWASMGGAGIVSSAEDLQRFTNALTDGVLLEPSTEARMRVPALKKWALGWEVSDTPFGRLVMKGGASEYGFTSQLRRYTDRNVVIILLLNAAQRADEYPHQIVGPAISQIVLGR